MDEIYIVNYCHPALTPFLSITSLPEEESFRVARSLSSAHAGASFRRFGIDYEGYYPHRMRAEAWLYENFLAIGGEPEIEHPHYFALNGSELLRKWYGGAVAHDLPLSKIESRHISFTFGDSHSMLNKPNRRPPIRLEALLALIESRGSVQNLLDEIAEEFCYIEAQLWSNEYLPLARRETII